MVINVSHMHGMLNLRITNYNRNVDFHYVHNTDKNGLLNGGSCIFAMQLLDAHH